MTLWDIARICNQRHVGPLKTRANLRPRAHAREFASGYLSAYHMYLTVSLRSPNQTKQRDTFLYQSIEFKRPLTSLIRSFLTFHSPSDGGAPPARERAEI